jgi:hypothetical protein
MDKILGMLTLVTMILALVITPEAIAEDPDWHESTMIVLTNAVRMAPIEYKDKYMSYFCPSPCSVLSTYPAVAPLYWNRDLNEAARSHAEDMLHNGCFSHSSCDGTSWDDRIRSFCPWANYIAENIAAGTSLYEPMRAVNLLLYDDGAPDYSSGAGHRTNIMRSTMNVIGTGYASGPEGYRNYWVQDFAYDSETPAEPIVAGSHLFLESGTITFLVNYYDASGAAPQKLVLVLDGVEHELSLDLGDPAAGTYKVKASRDNDCRSYHFFAIDGAGKEWRYPSLGEFRTFGEGSCADFFDANPEVVKPMPPKGLRVVSAN